MTRICFFLALLFAGFGASAQELNCRVTVNSSQIQGSEKSAFDALQQSVTEFMNQRKWTNDVFQTNERIDCSILINLTDRISNNVYKASIQVQATRPVYGTSYKTTIINHKDPDVQFNYIQFDVLDFTLQSHVSNLTSMLAFYAYMIVAIDYETFSPNGGQDLLQKALTIVNNAQSAGEPGWKAFESDKNRYWMVEHFLDRRFSALRECYYKYHRLGFDVMSDNVDRGRGEITKALLRLEKVHQAVPNSFNMRMFFNSKSDEIVKLYSNAQPDEKNQVLEILEKVDPGNITKYNKIREAK